MSRHLDQVWTPAVNNEPRGNAVNPPMPRVKMLRVTGMLLQVPGLKLDVKKQHVQ